MAAAAAGVVLASSVEVFGISTQKITPNHWLPAILTCGFKSDIKASVLPPSFEEEIVSQFRSQAEATLPVSYAIRNEEVKRVEEPCGGVTVTVLFTAKHNDFEPNLSQQKPYERE